MYSDFMAFESKWMTTSNQKCGDIQTFYLFYAKWENKRRSLNLKITGNLYHSMNNVSLR